MKDGIIVGLILGSIPIVANILGLILVCILKALDYLFENLGVFFRKLFHYRFLKSRDHTFNQISDFYNAANNLLTNRINISREINRKAGPFVVNKPLIKISSDLSNDPRKRIGENR